MTTNTYRSGASKAWVATAILVAILVALFGPKPAWASEPNFAPARHFAVGTSPTTVTHADFNGDGKVDLAAQNFGTDNVSVLLGNGDGTFQTKKDFPVGDGPTAVVSGQFNDDNSDNKVDSSDFVDLAIANEHSDSVSVLLGNGDGTFQTKKDYLVNPDNSCCPDPISLVTEDFNGDGKADLAIANSSSAYVRIMLGDGAGSFQAAGSFNISSMSNQISTEDFNGDGKADLAVTYYGIEVACCRGGVSVFLGNGDGTFRNGGNPLRLFFAFSVASGDFNGDGKADVAAVGVSGDVSAALGNGDGTFQGQREFTAGTTPSAVASADFDGDGYADMAVSNHDSDNVSVLYSSGDRGFEAAQNFAAGDGPLFVDAPNANADNSADLAIVNDISNNVSVLTNNRPPNTSIGSGPMGTVTSRTANFTFSSSQASSTFECSLDGAPFAGCTSPRTVPASGLLADGSHTFKVRATDATGHTDPTPATRTWTVDSAAPTVASFSPADRATGIVLNTTVSAIFSEAMDPSTLTTSTFTLTRQGSSTPVTAQVSYDGTNKKATLDPSSDLEANTLYTATIKGGTNGIRDAVGNPLAADKVWSFSTVDTIAPTAPVIASPAEGSLLNTRSFSVSGTAEANSTVELLEGTNSLGTAQANGSGQWSIALSGVTDGPHAYTARAEDTSGNVSEGSVPRNVRVDATAPPSPTISSPLNNSFDTDGNVTVSGAAEPGSTVQLFEGQTSRGTTPADSSGAWSMTLSAVGEGAHTYSARATDAADNTSGPSNLLTVRIDTTSPTVVGTTPLNRAANVGLGTNLTATFSEKMKASTINTTTFKLYRVKSDGTQTQITNTVVSLSSDGLKATLNPFGTSVTQLAKNTRYKGVLTTGTKDRAGNPLAQQNTWTFTTRP
jgi:hypothetical protein